MMSSTVLPEVVPVFNKRVSAITVPHCKWGGWQAHTELAMFRAVAVAGSILLPSTHCSLTPLFLPRPSQRATGSDSAGENGTSTVCTCSHGSLLLGVLGPTSPIG